MWTTSHRHLLILTVCVANYGGESAAAGPTVIPDWVRQRPHVPGFIIGIGSAPVGESTTAGPNRALAAGVSALELTALSAAMPDDEVVEALRLRLVPNAESSTTLPAGTGEIVTVRLAADCGDDVDAPSCGAGVPVRWRLVRGAGELTPLTWTDDDGRASTRMTRLDGTVSQPSVIAAIDLAAFHHRPKVTVELNRLPVPAATLVIPRPPRLSAQVSLIATADGLANVISTKLGTRGVAIVEAGGDLSVQVQAELQRQHDDGDGVHLFHSGLSELKGSGRTGREAVRSALDEADSLFDEAVTQSSRWTLKCAEVSGLGVLFSDSSKPAIQAALGLGDIAQMEVGAIAIVSNLRNENELAAVHTAGLKVHVPLGTYVRGVSASFQRSGSHTDVVDFVDWSAKIGEFHTVATFANHAPEDVETAAAGWNGLKLQTHAGFKDMDARLKRGTDPGYMSEIEKTFWRPVFGFEVWRDNSRARVVGELNWMTSFDDANGGTIEDVPVVSGGVRFFFSKHATFDIGVRQQSNYDGVAESAIQTKLTLHLPTHTFRDRVVGN